MSALGDNVADATGKTSSKHIRRLVVLNESGKLAGILSLGDVAIDYGAMAVGKPLSDISENTPAALRRRTGPWRAAAMW